MRMIQLGARALVVALFFSLPAHASLADDDGAIVSSESCFRVHIVYALNPSSGELIPKIRTCLSRDNADEFQSCFSRSIDGGFGARQAVDACRAKYNVSLFDAHI